MKFLSLVLCVGMLCITTASRGLLQPHHLNKRQADSEDACTAGTIEDLCTSGYYLTYANVLLECNQLSTALVIQDGCQSTGTGKLCGTFNTYQIGSSILSVCGRFPSNCSQDCRDLLVSARAELGCCISNFNNSDRYDPTPYSNELWSLCDMETVTEECAPGFIELQETAVDPSCTPAVLNERLFSEALCRRQFLESQRAASIEFCDEETNTINDCTVNEFGRYCILEQVNYRSLINVASSSCTNTSTCDPLCVETLSSITGCCFISQFNDTSSAESYDWLSYEFWTQCNLTSPGFCELMLNDEPYPNANAASRNAPGITVATAFAALLLTAIQQYC